MSLKTGFQRSHLLEKSARVSHGFGTRSEPIPLISPGFLQTWDERRVDWKQVHGTALTCVTSANQRCGEVDALYTRTPGQPIAVVTADCVPILMARCDGKAVAAVHAGWRGTYARILKVLWKQLTEEGEHPQDWVAAVGPAIGPCCYEVSTDLAQDFSDEFGQAVVSQRMLDLPAIQVDELKDIGLREVDLMRICTRCTQSQDSTFSFHSYRREGSGVRQYSVIMIQPNE